MVVNGTKGQGSEDVAWMKDAAGRWRIGRNKWRGKRDQPSHTLSSREKCQINIRRIKLPIIIGP
jgi:hypothetical protein